MYACSTSIPGKQTRNDNALELSFVLRLSDGLCLALPQRLIYCCLYVCGLLLFFRRESGI